MSNKYLIHSSNTLRNFALATTIGATCLIMDASAQGSKASSNNWKVEEGNNPDGLGSAVTATYQGKTVARFIYGEGQIKPYLHLFDDQGQPITNTGIDAEGEKISQYPHHRGIFIGWNQIKSELGNDDLWHLNKNATMEVTAIKKVKAAETYAEITAEISWNSAKADDSGNPQLLTETRTLRLAKDADTAHITVDAHFNLTAIRDLTLGGDLQHAGVHFRANHALQKRAKESHYLWHPEVDGGKGRIVNEDMQWCALAFPREDQWYLALQLNSPDNKTQEVSWRDYGRFGFFFNEDLKKGQSLQIKHRFHILPIEGDLNDETQQESLLKALRTKSELAYKSFTATK